VIEDAVDVVGAAINLILGANSRTGKTRGGATRQVARLQSFDSENGFVSLPSRGGFLRCALRKARQNLRKPTVEGGTLHAFSRGNGIRNGKILLKYKTYCNDRDGLPWRRNYGRHSPIIGA
jgi:hypothetical protein